MKTISQDQVREEVEEEEVEATNKEGGGEESSKVEKKGGFAGSPLRREAGLLAGRANPGMEVTPTSNQRRRFQNLCRRSTGGEGGVKVGACFNENHSKSAMPTRTSTTAFVR